MQKIKAYLWILTWIICLTLPPLAGATTMTQAYDFSFTGFTKVYDFETVVPIDPFTGSVTITFDPDKTYGPFEFTTEGIALNTLSYTLDSASTMWFAYDPSSKVMMIGSVIGWGIGCGGNNFLLSFTLDSDYSDATSNYFAYATETNVFRASTGSVDVSTVSSAVSEPATLLLLNLGLIGLAGVVRKLQ